MINRKFMLMAIFLVGLLAVSAVSANEINSTGDIVSEEMAVDDNLEVIPEDTISTTHNVSGNTFEDIQNAVDGANDGDTVELSGNYGGNGKEININKQLNIVGLDKTVLDAKSSSRIFNIAHDNVVIKNLNFINGNSSDGGAIYVENNDLKGYIVSCFDCSFVNNYAAHDGGAIYGWNLSVFNCKFVNNSANGDGGAMNGGSAENCTFSNNMALGTDGLYGKGGAMVFGSDATNCNFTDNYAAHDGGALYYVYAVDCLFINNHADEDGGAISYADAVNCTFICNSATGVGGAIYCYEGEDLNFLNCRFLNNAARSRGAISLNYYCTDAKVINCSFENNHVSNDVGALYLQGDGGFVSNCIFINNSAGQFSCGAIEWSGAGGKLVNSTFLNMENPLIFDSDYGEVSDCIFENNAGVIIDWKGMGKSTLSDCKFINNDAYEFISIGKWIFSSVSRYDNFTIENSIINNMYGGAVNIDNNILTITNSITSDGYISVKIANETFEKRVNSSETQFNLNGIKSGTYYANIYFSGDSDEYEASEMNIPITIESSYKLRAYDVTKYCGGSEKFTVILYKDDKVVANANVKITVNGKIQNVKTDSKGQATVDLDLPVGTYDVTSVYGDVSTTSKVTVKSTLTASDASGTYWDSKVSATFLNVDGKVLASKQVTFKIGDKSYSATTNADGVAIANIDLGVGTYTVTAINPVNKEEKQFKLVISKADSKVNLTSAQSNGVVTLTAALTPAGATGNVAFNVNGEDKAASIKNGKAILNLNGLESGNYTVTAVYNGDANLKASTSNAVTFNVAEAYPILTAKNLTKTYGNSNNLIVYLKDNKGNAIAKAVVNVDINGKITPITTDSNGQAKMPITLKPAEYTATITYTDAQTTAKILVKKATPKITASKKTFKASVKTKKYTITLKTNKNKAMKSKKVTLKVNGKTYSAKTNSKGQATFKITKLTKKGTFNAVVKFAGNDYYNKVTKTVKITTKK